MDMIVRDKSDSIKVSRTAKGEHSWEIKIYFDEGMAGEDVRVISKLETINAELTKRFKG